jgi:hypothetical protein
MLALKYIDPGKTYLVVPEQRRVISLVYFDDFGLGQGEDVVWKLGLRLIEVFEVATAGVNAHRSERCDDVTLLDGCFLRFILRA